MPNFKILGVSTRPLSLEMAKIWPFYGQNMVLTQSFKLIFWNYNQWAKECSMPNFTILNLSHSPLFLKMAKIGPFCGQNMVLQIVIPESYSMCPGMLHAKFHNSRCIPLSPFPRNGQDMALLWPNDGPHMVLQIGSFRIIIIVPRYGPCQIS